MHIRSAENAQLIMMNEFQSKNIIEGVQSIALGNNFTGELISIEEGDSVNNNGTWTGLIGLFQRMEADLSLFPKPMEYNHLNYTRYLPFPHRNEIVILSPLSGERSMGDMMDNFTKMDWQMVLLIIFGIIVCQVTGTVIETLHRSWIDEDTSSVNQEFSFMMWVAFHVYMGASRIPRYTSFRILTIFSLFYTMVLICAAFAFIKTSIVVSNGEIVSSISDLLKSKKFKPRVVHGGQLLNFWKASDDEEYRKLTDVVENGGGIEINLSSMEDLMKLATNYTIDVNEVVILEPFVSNSVGELICEAFPGRTYIVKKVEFSGTMYGLPVNKHVDPTVHAYIKKRIMMLSETGVLTQFIHLVEGGTPPCFVETIAFDDQEVEFLTIESFAKSFYLLSTGLLMGILVFCFEMLYFKISSISV